MNPIFLIVILVICVIIVFILADRQSRKIPTTFPEELGTSEDEEEDEDLEEEEEEGTDEDNQIDGNTSGKALVEDGKPKESE